MYRKHRSEISGWLEENIDNDLSFIGNFTPQKLSSSSLGFGALTRLMPTRLATRLAGSAVTSPNVGYFGNIIRNYCG